jgi:DNA polymerase III subunit epsilon
MMLCTDENLRHEAMAATLDSTGNYRVLRRLRPKSRYAATARDVSMLRVAVVVDVETTGLDHERDEIIELAMVKFTYDAEGFVHEVRETFEGLRQPTRPISPNITKLTGINDEMVVGKTLNPSDIAVFVRDVDLVVAHNAGFDRRFLERFCDSFRHKPWACSMSQIEWCQEGFEGTKLGYLAATAGFFYDRHRAAADCLATIELLATRLPVSGATSMGRLLYNARAPSWRIWAKEAPYDFKNVLKARGYRWNAGGCASPKAWYLDVGPEVKDSEIAYLRTEIYQRDVEPMVRKITAYDRFSDRS